MSEGPIRIDKSAEIPTTMERKPTADFPALNDDQIVWMAENSTGDAAVWAQRNCATLDLPFDSTVNAADRLRTQRLTGVPNGMEPGSLRPSANCPELTSEQITELARGNSEYAEWAQWAERQN